MVNIKDKVFAELDNIGKVVEELEKVKDISDKEQVVLAGIGAYIQNIYSGMENIFKQLLIYKNVPIPTTSTWHKDLLNLSVKYGFITNAIAQKVGKYLFFRHFFVHSYSFLIEEEKLKPLVENAFDVYNEFKKQILNYLERID